MNINTFIPFSRNALSTAVCLGLVAISPNVQAVVLNGSATTSTGTTSDAQFDSNPTAVNVYSSSNDAEGDSYSAARGNDAGWMYSYAQGSNTFSSTGNIQQVVEFTNTSAFAQSYSFDFTINRGSLSSYLYPPAAGYTATSSNKAVIKLNGVEIFNSEATLTTTDAGSTLTTSGTTLGTYSAGSSGYSWSAFSDTLDLGTFGVGESFTLEYDIFTLASSNAIQGPEICETYGDYGDYGYGDGGEFGGEGGTYCYSQQASYARSQFGDPNGLESTPIDTTTVTGQRATVTEESSFLLFGAGIAGLAFSRRRKNRNN